VLLLLKDGQTLSGINTAETEADLTLIDNQGQKRVALKSDIEQQKPSPVSTMPDGLEKRFTDQEFVDLIAYLTSLKESQTP
jgi:putative heme-binding domain-containing protein